MKRLLLLAGLCALCACSGMDSPGGMPDSGTPDGGHPDGGAPDGSIAGLEKPTELTRAPSGGLPADLFPPR
jgi:hypothetical protein